MEAGPKATSDESQEKVHLDYIPVDVVQRILTYPARRAAKLAELAAGNADTPIDGKSQDTAVMSEQKSRWAETDCDVLNASDIVGSSGRSPT